jgi:hypothetical protein
MRLKMIYFGYNYSDRPHTRTQEIKDKVQALIQRRTDIIPIIPRLVFDELLDHPSGYEHTFIPAWETEVIARCDGVCFPKPSDEAISIGVLWEQQIARWLNVPEYTYNELMEKLDLVK